MLVFVLCSSTVSAQIEEGTGDAAEETYRTFDHTGWDFIVSRYVNDDGRFDYNGLLTHPTDIDRLTAYLERLELANLSFEEQTFDDLEPGSVDFLLTLDVLHDIPRPADAVAAARRAIADDGVWLVADIKASPTFEENRRNPMISLFYSMSVIYCMNSALSEPDGAGLGTLGLHPERLRGLVEGAGFSSFAFREFDEDVSNRYFEIRP